MKKLLFVLAFAFIGQQSFSQVYIMTYSQVLQNTSGCSFDHALTKIDPTGNVTYTCVTRESIGVDPVTLVTINIKINNFIKPIKKRIVLENEHHFQKTSVSHLLHILT